MKKLRSMNIITIILTIGFQMQVSAGDLTTSSKEPAVNYKDTDYYGGVGNIWTTYAQVTNTSTGAGYWGLYDDRGSNVAILIKAYTDPVLGTGDANVLSRKSNGDVCLAGNALCVSHSNNKSKSFVVNHKGDISLASDSIFINRSVKNIGIGTISPLEKVDIEAKSAAARFQLSSITNTANQAAQFIQRRAHVSSGSPDAVENGDNIGLFSFRGWNGSGWTGSKAVISVAATEDWSETENGNQISFRHTPNGSNTMVTALQVKGHGDVYIPEGNLYVRGINVPDYVFEKNYQLMPLDELKAYVNKNNHLPGVASADEVDKAGVVNLSGLQMTLLEKVEELTLYILQQEEALVAKDTRINMMEVKQRVKDVEMEAMRDNIETRQRAQDEKIAKLESILTGLALDTSTSSQEKVSMK